MTFEPTKVRRLVGTSQMFPLEPSTYFPKIIYMNSYLVLKYEDVQKYLKLLMKIDFII